MYVECDEQSTPDVAERINRIVTGFALDGFESGMAIEHRNDDDDDQVTLIPFEADDT